jgi:hypothetical protein
MTPADVLAAVEQAEQQAHAAHVAGQCGASEWSCSWCEVEQAGGSSGNGCACGRVHAASEVVALGRFRPDGPLGYSAADGEKVRATRAAAMRDVCESWAPRTGEGAQS